MNDKGPDYDFWDQANIVMGFVIAIEASALILLIMSISTQGQ